MKPLVQGHPTIESAIAVVRPYGKHKAQRIRLIKPEFVYPGGKLAEILRTRQSPGIPASRVQR